MEKKIFHGAVYYGELKEADLSYQFIDSIERQFEPISFKEELAIKGKGIDEVKNLAKHFAIDDINFIKPGIGEATRVLLRRLPWKVLISPEYKESLELRHLIRLAKEKDVPIEYYPLNHYKCCGIIKQLADT
ncbi:hypothetical protein P261_02760 [Lachnospiraceae bacterium TWA4]|nr:hypothetical protein P261_02760 [Lachnospiraceae bacterium TWA4]